MCQSEVVEQSVKVTVGQGDAFRRMDLTRTCAFGAVPRYWKPPAASCWTSLWNSVRKGSKLYFVKSVSGGYLSPDVGCSSAALVVSLKRSYAVTAAATRGSRVEDGVDDGVTVPEVPFWE